MCKKVVVVCMVFVVKREIEFECDVRKVSIIIDKKKIGIFARVFPSAKTNQNEFANRNIIIASRTTLEFIANMTKQLRSISNISIKHAIAEHLGNRSDLLEIIVISRKTQLCGTSILRIFPCHAFGFISSVSIANHVYESRVEESIVYEYI